MAFDPFTSPCGEEPGYPQIRSTPAGGVSVKRCLHVLTDDVYDWFVYFLQHPIDPYTQNGNLWSFAQRPFEKQWRGGRDIGIYGPGVAAYKWALIDLEYESVGMRFYPGFGVVKESFEPREQHEPVGIIKQMTSSADTQTDTLKWETNDPEGKQTLYYGEHPEFMYGGGVYKVTFPFAPSATSPFVPGDVNSDSFTPFCLTTGACAPGQMKYIGIEAETSVAIPYVGFKTGLTRTRKTLVFHWRFIDWNKKWRARDQKWDYMLDAAGNRYIEYTPTSFNSASWWF